MDLTCCGSGKRLANSTAMDDLVTIVGKLQQISDFEELQTIPFCRAFNTFALSVRCEDVDNVKNVLHVIEVIEHNDVCVVIMTMDVSSKEIEVSKVLQSDGYVQSLVCSTIEQECSLRLQIGEIIRMLSDNRIKLSNIYYIAELVPTFRVIDIGILFAKDYRIVDSEDAKETTETFSGGCLERRSDSDVEMTEVILDEDSIVILDEDSMV